MYPGGRGQFRGILHAPPPPDTPRYGQPAVGTHAFGMHSCYMKVFRNMTLPHLVSGAVWVGWGGGVYAGFAHFLEVTSQAISYRTGEFSKHNKHISYYCSHTDTSSGAFAGI